MTCTDCNACSRCGCNCRGELAPIKFVKNGVDLDRNRSKTFRFNRSRRLAAAELEIAKGGDKRVDEVINKYGMSVVHDGSIHGGVEINTAPANGDALFAQIADLSAALVASGAKVDQSCGFHLHVDCRDYTWDDMRKAMLAWAHIEEEAYALVPSSRRKNQYCMKRAKEIKDALDFSTMSARRIKERVMLVISNNNPRPTNDNSNFDYARPPQAMFERCAEGICGCDTTWQRRWSNYRESYRNYEAGHDLRMFNQNYGLPPNMTAPESGERDCRYDFRHGVEGHKMYLAAKKKNNLFHPHFVKTTRPARKGRKGNNTVGGDRYYGFNVQAWFEHGTIELRLHTGTVDGTKVKHWAALWTNFFDWVKAASMADIRQFCSISPQAAFLALAPSTSTREWMEMRREKFADAKVAQCDDSLDIDTDLTVRPARRRLALTSATVYESIAANLVTPQPEQPVAPRVADAIDAINTYPYTDTGYDDSVEF
jgi:hypothetical protein